MTLGRETVVGWAEYVDLPDWKIRGLRAKSDTGAQSSALHVENLKRLRGNKLAFDVVIGRRAKQRVRVRAPLERMGMVKSSNGTSERRPFVKTRLRIGREVREIELNLVDRSAMLHRMLLGRTALEGLLVDVSKRYVTQSRPKRKRVERAKSAIEAFPTTPAPVAKSRSKKRSKKKRKKQKAAAR